MIRTRVRVLPGLAAALLSAGCQDELASPTKGFLDVDTGGVEGVEVFLDGQSVGMVSGSPLGPIAIGDHRVAVARECYESVLGEQWVTVHPAGTSVVEFVLVPREFGSAGISAADELTGEEIPGATILRKVGDQFVDTGLTTPATLEGLPCGPTTFLIRSDGYADRQVDTRIDTGVVTAVRGELGPPRKVLAEMFTYVTCPNCPEAADSLQALQATRPGRVLVVEWHTLAPLPLYDPRWVERESTYGGGAAWPSVVLQGGYADTPALLVGSQTSNLLEYRTRADAYLAECEGDCDYTLASSAVQHPGAVDLEAWVKWRGGAPRGSLVLRFVVVQREVVLGPRLFHDVPRNYAEQAVSFGAPGEILRFSVSLPVNPLWGELDHLVYLQSDASLEILAVDGTS
jgi:hypothetical protein